MLPMNSDFLEKLLQRFDRAADLDAAGSGPGRGSGLGLRSELSPN